MVFPTRSRKQRIVCVLCKAKLYRISQSHLDRIHDGLSLNQYLKLPNAILSKEPFRTISCDRCGEEFTKIRVKKVNYCDSCKRVQRNAKKRDKRDEKTSETEQKRKAQFYFSLSESEQELIGEMRYVSTRNGEAILDYKRWDFVRGKRGRGKYDIGFEGIGTIQDSDLEITTDRKGNKRIKAMIELDKEKRKHKRRYGDDSIERLFE